MIRNKLHKIAGFTAIMLASIVMPSCDEYSSQTDDLVNLIPDALDECDEAIEQHAEELIDEFVADPELLAKETTAEYMGFGDHFTLTIAYDRVGRAAVSAFLGDLGDMANAFDDADRQNKTKKNATQYIDKHFDNRWALLFSALCALDGKFTLEYETDFINNGFDYESKELMKKLDEHGVLSGGYAIGNTETTVDDYSFGNVSTYNEEEGDGEYDVADYEGTIAGKNVKMELTYCDGDITGTYSYVGNSGHLDLVGKYDGEHITMVESYQGEKTGSFDIYQNNSTNPTTLSGSMINHKGKKYKVDLREVN